MGMSMKLYCWRPQLKRLCGGPIVVTLKTWQNWQQRLLDNTPERQQGKRSDICLKPDHYTKLVQLHEARVRATPKIRHSKLAATAS
jgi:hypothetical protein